MPAKDLSSQDLERRSPITDLLHESPPLNELQEHVKIGSKWFAFGVLLNINPTYLSTIEQLDGDSDSKALKMFQKWLDTNQNATRMKVIKTLAKEAIGEMTLATLYQTALERQGNLTRK